MIVEVYSPNQLLALVSASGPAGKALAAHTAALPWVGAAAGAGAEPCAGRALAFESTERRRNERRPLISVSCTNIGG